MVGTCDPALEILDSVSSNHETSAARVGKVEHSNNNSSDLPGHLKVILEGCGKILDAYQQAAVENLLRKYGDIFAVNKTDRGRTDLVQHQINTGNDPPFKQRPRHLPISQREVETEEIEKMLSSGVIEPSESLRVSPIVLARKKDGSIQYCIDYSQLNDLTIKDSYPLPRTQDCLDELLGSVWFSTLDLQSGY